MKCSRPPLKQVLKEPAIAYGGLGGEVVIYQAPDWKVKLNVRLEKGSLWLTQKQMALLFDTEWSVITKYLRNIFASEDLDRNSVCSFFAHTAEDGKTYQTQFYNLDAIISVGYRVKYTIPNQVNAGSARPYPKGLHDKSATAKGAQSNY